MTFAFSDTIVALASAPGRAGVAVLRLSGPQAQEATLRLCFPSNLPAPRVAALRDIVDWRTQDVIDHALVLFFPAPHSFTGEDVVEFHLHGGRAILNATLEALCALPSVRPAEAGEFTRRAFENGKMDLTEAEGIADLVDAETAAQRRQALRQMDGELGRLYYGWAERLTQNLAYIEAEIDFADEEIPPDLSEGRREDIAALSRDIAAHLDDHHRGERLREGFTVALLGAPNAGKSSLLNALARREAAIVSPIAGTTRDIIEVQLDLGGYPVTLADTAGLRETADTIESEGVRRALARAEQADLKLLIFDGSADTPLDAATKALIDDCALLVINKGDLAHTSSLSEPYTESLSGASPPPRGEGQGGGQQETSLVALPPLPNPSPQGGGALGSFFWREKDQALLVSAKTGEGLEVLSLHLVAEIEKRFVGSGGPALTRVRHRVALQEALEHLTRAQAAREVELFAEDLRLAIRALGRITGTVDVEDLLDIIFSSFCIGK